MNDKRRALGRGLGALIPTDPVPEGRPVDVFFRDRAEGVARQGFSDVPRFGSTSQSTDPPEAPATGAASQDEAWRVSLRPIPGAQFAEIPVRAIRPNPRQPRMSFDADELAELVYSVQQVGILQPVVVRAAGSQPAQGEDARDADYELVMGERRWRAAQAAGLEFVPAIVKQTSDDALLRDALLENLHRTDLNPLEEAAAYQQLLDDFGCTQEELSSRIGRSRPQISNTLRLLRLPPPVQRRVAAAVLSAGHARALLALEDAAAMERLAQRIVAEGLSVRSVEEIVAVGVESDTGTRGRRTAHVERLDDVSARLSDRLDTRVLVALGKRKGRMTIEFAGTEDLSRILGILGLPST